jgi:hypothetical protein
MKNLLFTLGLALALPALQAQVAIGTTTPEASAILQLESTSKGFLPPRLTSAQRDAIPSPAEGMVIYNTTDKRLEFSDGSNWFNLADGSSITAVNGNAASGSAGVYLGASATTLADANALLELESTSHGFLPPRLTAAQRDAIASPAEGLIIYNTESDCLESFNGSYWISLCVGTVQAGACVGEPTEFTFNGLTYKPVESDGKCWLDRNLGATQVATGPTDANSYGDLYQWGRAADGHEKRTSDTTSTNATTAVPNAGNSWDGQFITEASLPFDWLTARDNTLWQGVNGTNNPCPSGYRLPTEAELNAERLSWSSPDSAGAFGSPLKLPAAGLRDRSSGSLFNVGSFGLYWSSTDSGANARRLDFDSSDAFMSSNSRAGGASVRCLKD